MKIYEGDQNSSSPGSLYVQGNLRFDKDGYTSLTNEEGTAITNLFSNGESVYELKQDEEYPFLAQRVLITNSATNATTQTFSFKVCDPYSFKMDANAPITPGANTSYDEQLTNILSKVSYSMRLEVSAIYVVDGNDDSWADFQAGKAISFSNQDAYVTCNAIAHSGTEVALVGGVTLRPTYTTTNEAVSVSVTIPTKSVVYLEFHGVLI